jgi:ribosomal protein L7/L12
MSMNIELELQSLRGRVSKLEAELRFIYKHLSVTYVPEPFALDAADKDVAEYLEKGDVMGALKTYRMVHNVSLEEAKAAVDEIKASLGY